jgi:hypothetical protein
MQDKRGEKSSWDLRPIRRMQGGRHAGQERREILLGPEADPEDAGRPACRTREEINPLGTWGQILRRSGRTSHYFITYTPLHEKNTEGGK